MKVLLVKYITIPARNMLLNFGATIEPTSHNLYLVFLPHNKFTLVHPMSAGTPTGILHKDWSLPSREQGEVLYFDDTPDTYDSTIYVPGKEK